MTSYKSPSPSATGRGTVLEWCRACKDERDDLPYDERLVYEIQPADFIVWGKLFPASALGPRCYDHAAREIGHYPLARDSGYAVFDLRGLSRAAAEGVGRSPESSRP